MDTATAKTRLMNKRNTRGADLFHGLSCLETAVSDYKHLRCDVRIEEQAGTPAMKATVCLFSDILKIWCMKSFYRKGLSRNYAIGCGGLKTCTGNNLMSQARCNVEMMH